MTMDAADLRMFGDAVRGVAQTRSGAALDTALDQLGWRDALVDDSAVTAVMFAILGEHCASSSALDDVVTRSLDIEPSPSTAVAMPPIGSSLPPALMIDDRLIVNGVGTRRMLTATAAVIVVSHQDREITVTVDPGDLGRRAVRGMDPDGGWVEITADLPVPNLDTAPDAAWSDAVIAGQLAIASELVAGSRAMLGLARDHAVERVQFGVPIASFQAVRHRLAEALFAVESADSAVAASWEDRSAYTAGMAKAIAGRTSRTVARHAQQVLAGMGFTSEHRFHHYFRRALVLDQLFGSSASLSEQIGREALRTGTLPPVRPL